MHARVSKVKESPPEQNGQRPSEPHLHELPAHDSHTQHQLLWPLHHTHKITELCH
jgi:hypothetical protein